MKKINAYIKSLSFYETLKHGSVYTLAFVFTQLISVITLPIFTKLLLPADFGIYEVFNNTVRVLGIVVSLNLFNGFYRFYFDEHLSKQDLMQYLLRTSCIAFVICVVLMLVFQKQFIDVVSLPKNLFIWILIAVFTNIIFNYFNTYNTAQHFSKQAGIWQFITQLLRVLSAILFIIFWKRNYVGRIVGENLILLVLGLIILLFYFRKYIGFSDNLQPETKREILKYSVSFIPIGLSGFVLGYLDTIMINSFKGSNDAGLYSYAYKFAVIYTGITTAFVTANRPKLFELLNQKKEEEVIAQMRSMFKLVVALSALFIFFAADGGKILALNDAFNAGLHLMPILILSYIFNDLNELYSFYFHYEKKVNYFYYSFAVSAIVNFVLNWIFIPKYGYAAAAYTTLISYGFMLVCTYIICKKIVLSRVPAVIRFVDYLAIIALVLLVNYLATHYIGNIVLQIATKGLIYILILAYLWRNILQQFLRKQA
ncbi:MAG: oligosaccharide flippase family protein [Bacteroidetes bacterium]|nr:oligosaccharide flippase family protein [Bacteroidota bacterium]